MFRGKFWFKDGCTIIVNNEHAVIARNRLVGWSKTRQSECIGPLTPEEIKCATTGLNAAQWRLNALEDFKAQSTPDPRIWFINLGAIRVRENMFWMDKITSKKQREIAQAKEFWRLQVGYGLSEFDILEFFGLDGTNTEISFAKFAEKHPHDLSGFLADSRRNLRAIVK